MPEYEALEVPPAVNQIPSNISADRDSFIYDDLEEEDTKEEIKLTSPVITNTNTFLQPPKPPVPIKPVVPSKVIIFAMII